MYIKKSIFLLILFAVSIVANDTIYVAATPGTEKFFPLVTAIYKEMNFKTTFKTLPSERAIAQTDDGICGAEIGRAKNVLGKYKNIIYTKEPIISVRLKAWIVDNSTISISSPEELLMYKVGIVHGIKGPENFCDQHKLNYETLPTIENLAGMLKLNRIDIAIVPDAINQSALDSIGHPLAYDPGSYSVYHVFNRKNAFLITKWDSILKVMKANGQYIKLLSQEQSLSAPDSIKSHR
jgi:ABC-type amino acid transport substrate-binding protein